jgi:monovalent cation:proton antiporter-2 (CPA2) family protein
MLIELAILLAAAVVAVPLFKRLGLGSVLGYLAAGAAIGPSGFGLIGGVEEKMHTAEFGVVLLLFLIGLELAPARLWRMRGTVFGLGSLQMLACGLLLAGAAALVLGLPPAAAVVVGLALSLSSTAFVLQILAERKELAAPHGRSAFGILLFQDLAAIPLLAIVPALGTAAAGASASGAGSAWQQAGVVVAAFVLLVLAGRYLLRPLFRVVMSVGSHELSTAVALLVVIGTSLLMHEVKLSMALGSFLAGVLLAESEYRHELEANIEPFKGLLLGFFFISVGMSARLAIIVQQPALLLGLVLGLTVVKLAALFLVARLTGHPRAPALKLAVALSQGGEFAFVIFGVAVQGGLLPVPMRDLLIVVVSLSMVLTPLLFLAVDRLLPLLARSQAALRPYDEIPGAEGHVIIAGFGRFGQIVARILRGNRIPFTALEINTTQVDFVRQFGSAVYYGDASRVDLLRAARVGEARLFVLCIDDPEASVRTAETVLHNFPGVPIIARARNRQHAYGLMALDIKVVIRETLYSSLMVARRTLQELGLSPAEAREAARKFEEHDAEQLVEQFKVRDDQRALIATAKKAAADLEKIFQQDSSAKI